MRIMMTSGAPNRNRRRAAAATELALLLPVLMMLLLMSVDFARLFYHYITVTNCARNGAVWASNSALIRANSPYTSAADAAMADGASLNPPISAGNVTQSSGTDADGSTYVEVTVSYNFTRITSYLPGPKTTTLSYKVRMRVLPDIPG